MVDVAGWWTRVGGAAPGCTHGAEPLGLLRPLPARPRPRARGGAAPGRTRGAEARPPRPLPRAAPPQGTRLCSSSPLDALAAPVSCSPVGGGSWTGRTAGRSARSARSYATVKIWERSSLAAREIWESRGAGEDSGEESSARTNLGRAPSARG